jgi:uncharacterized Tic20 family protein
MMTPSVQSTPGDAELTWAMTAHLVALSLYPGLIVVNLQLPYLIWRWKFNQSDYVAAHALAAFNFQVSALIVLLIALIMACLLPPAWLLAMVLGTASIIMDGKAADHAKCGQSSRYPFAFRWLR